MDSNDTALKPKTTTECLLHAVVEASLALLVPDFMQGLHGALKELSQHTAMDRVYVLRFDTRQQAGFFVAEECAPGISSVMDHLGPGPYHYKEYEEVWKPLTEGRIYTSKTQDKTGANAELNLKVGNKSDLFVPIFLSGQFWGAVGFDDCTTERLYSEPEIKVLQGVATAISHALAREHQEHQRLEVERARTQEAEELNQLMQAVVSASRALLEEEDFQQGLYCWLAFLAESVGADRAVLGGFCVDRPEEAVAFAKVEWVKQGVKSTLDLDIPATSDFTDWAERLHRGETIWAHQDELHDPLSISFWEERGCKTNLLVPVVVDRQTEGWLCFDWITRQNWKPAYDTVLRTAAEGAASAIKRTKTIRDMLAEREKAALERAERITAHNAVLRSSAARLSIAADFDDVVGTSLAEVAQVLSADSAHLFLYQPQSHTLRLGMAWREGTISSQPAPSEPEIFATAVPADITPGFARLRDSRRFLRLTKGEFTGLEWPGVVDWFKTCGYHQAVALALMVGERPLGIMAFAFRTSVELNEQQAELLYALAAQMAIGLEFKNLAEASRDAGLAREQEAVAKATAAELALANDALGRSTERLVGENDLQLFLGSLMHEATSLSGAKSAGVFSYDEETEELRMIAFMTQGRLINIHSEPGMECWLQPVPLEISRPWMDALKQQDWLSFDSNADSQGHPWPTSQTWHHLMHHGLVIDLPLRAGGRLIGMLGQCFPTSDWPSGFRYEQTRILANHAALALHLARLSDRARSAATESAILQERNRIARDLHDTLAQGFTGVLTQLGAMEGAVELNQSDQITHYLERAKNLARFSLAEARSSVYALRPETNGEPLFSRLKTMILTMTQGTGLYGNITETGEAKNLGPAADWCAHKFVQETLANAVKHARAQSFRVELIWETDRLTIRASDDGRGFDPAKVPIGLGIQSMRERAAEAGGLFINESQSGTGSRLCVILPLSPDVAL